MGRTPIPPCRACGGIRFSIRTQSPDKRSGTPRKLVRYCLDCAARHARQQRAKRPWIDAAARERWRGKNRTRFREMQAAYKAAHREEVLRKDRERKARARAARRAAS